MTGTSVPSEIMTFSEGNNRRADTECCGCSRNSRLEDREVRYGFSGRSCCLVCMFSADCDGLEPVSVRVCECTASLSGDVALGRRSPSTELMSSNHITTLIGYLARELM